MSRSSSITVSRPFSSLFRALLGAGLLLAAACAGEVAPSGGSPFVDSDGDRQADGVDADGDGKADYQFGTAGAGLTFCSDLDKILVDADGDGLVDGLDLDCDGVVDVDLTPPAPPAPGGGGGGGGQSVCESSTAVNGETRTIHCENGSCSCAVDGTVVQTCTTAAADACDANATCCTFAGGTGGTPTPPPPAPTPTPTPPPPSGGSGSCSASSSVDGVQHEVSCTLGATTASCTCRTNGTVVDTCTAPVQDACVLPGGCCNF